MAAHPDRTILRTHARGCPVRRRARAYWVGPAAHTRYTDRYYRVHITDTTRQVHSEKVRKSLGRQKDTIRSDDILHAYRI